MMRINSNNNISAFSNKSNSKTNGNLQKNGEDSSRRDSKESYPKSVFLHNSFFQDRKYMKRFLIKAFFILLVTSNILCLMYLSLDRYPANKMVKFPKSSSEELWNIKRADMAYPYEHNIEGLEGGRPLIIAHRGASGMLPEHTPQAYQAAIASGADVIECDAALSSDNHVVCLHESWMNHSTDVASKFPASRAQEVLVEGVVKKDFFSVHFSLSELLTLRKVQARGYRDQQFNGHFPIATLKQFLQIAFESNRTVGVHVELKDPEFYNQHVTGSSSFEQLVVKEMLDNGCQDRNNFRCFVQSFDKISLRAVSHITKLPLLYLTKPPLSLPDQELDELSTWLYAVGPRKDQIFNSHGPTDLIHRCHKRGLKVHAYTFRNEGASLHSSAASDAYLEMALFFALRLDAFFSDFPHSAHSFLSALYAFHH